MASNIIFSLPVLDKIDEIEDWLKELEIGIMSLILKNRKGLVVYLFHNQIKFANVTVTFTFQI